MPLPSSKQELADWILRRLGAPVVNVEITDVQLEDAIDEAVQFYQEYHYDGAERAYRTLKIEGDVLNGNDRMHQGLTAPQYDPNSTEYRVGDRVMIYKSNGMPNKIYVKYDSEERVNFKIYYEIDSEGTYFVWDSELNIRDSEFIYDSEATNHVDSEGVYQLYDSDLHTAFVYTLDSENVDSEGIWADDSEYNKVLYDSDQHWFWRYDSDDEGKFVDSDGIFIEYDSDKHSPQVYVIDSEDGKFVDSDGEYVLYDSDKHITVGYESDSAGVLIDSDGTYVLFTSALYSSYSYDSESIKLDSDGNSTGRIPDSEGDLVDKYVRFILDKDSEEYVLYDSDKHVSIFYDSDGAGGQGNFGINLDRLFVRTVNVEKPQRFKQIHVQPTRYNLEAVQPQRYSRERYTRRYSRERVLQGVRFEYKIEERTRKNSYTFEQLFREEDIVLTEPVVDYDYSKAGQVGIPVPETIIGINKVFRVDNFSGMGMWNYEYQYFLNNFDFFYGNGGASSMGMTNYYITKSYMDLIDHMMNVQPAIRFNKARNRLYIDTSWTRLGNMTKSKDYYLMIECYEVNDPEIFGDVYKDKWLKRYSTALAKKQWGSNMKKYTNTELPGGLMVDGKSLYDEAVVEAKELEEELKGNQLEMDFIIG